MALVMATAEPSPQRRARVRELARTSDPDELLSLFAHLGVTTQLGRLLLDDHELELPGQVDSALSAARSVARHRGLLHQGLLGRLCRALEEAGVPAVPLKGAVLADSVYGDLGARQGSDIDLLVPGAHLQRAVAIATGQGWAEPAWAAPPGELPALHRELFHDSLPPLEIHWRVHWYETEFAEAAIARSVPTEDGWRRMAPADELACLLLFLARDGFAGLRQLVDVAAWWATLGRPGETAAAVDAVADRHPELRPPLTAAARYAEATTAIPAGSLLTRRGAAPPRVRAALRLADPWLAHSRPQVYANVSLVDGLLAPSGGRRQFIRRQLLEPDYVLVRRWPDLEGASRVRLASARAGHALRILGRYALASGALFGRFRSSGTDGHPGQ